MKALPPTVTELVQELDKLYPHRCWQPHVSEREAMYYSGKRSLIDELQARLTSNESRALKGALLKE